jgi:hypothetical protein
MPLSTHSCFAALQELVRFNRLIEAIHSSLASLKKALKGLVLMSTDLEALGMSMYDGRVPVGWMSKSYPSMKVDNNKHYLLVIFAELPGH